ncbi:MAG: hypothetical protein HY363_04495 [Candidatus Aenigmarchaeota archaeon]|nr:hypothetical protein [Candidatus Aenigmarchaeota archaeon]
MKKAISGTALIIAALVIAVVVIFAYSIFFVEQISKTKGLIGKIGRAVENQACKQQGDTLKLRLNQQTLPAERDTDSDGYPNSCDFCEGNSAGQGDDSNDVDNDGLPADCDDNPTEPVKPDASFKKICEDKSGTWREEPPKCTLQNQN